MHDSSQWKKKEDNYCKEWTFSVRNHNLRPLLGLHDQRQSFSFSRRALDNKKLQRDP